MNKKGNVYALLIILLLAVAVGGGGFAMYKMGAFSGESQKVVTTTQTAQQVAQATKEGDVASIGVYVRDLSNNNIDTKLAVATYCIDNDGTMVIDGTSSSTSAEITGKTSMGKTITCYAFSSDYQTLEPSVVTVDEEYEHVLIDAYTLADSAQINIYNDQLQTGTGGAVNLTGVGADATGTWQKLRIKNNDSDSILPLGGIYFNTVTSSNVSGIDAEGSATLYGMDHSSAKFVESDLSTSVSTRKDNWDFVFEVDDDSSKSGNQPLLLEENDYVETGSVAVTADGDGCSSAGELVSMYAFTKGYFRNTKSTGIGFGHETDASSASVVSADYTGDTWYCTA